MAAGITLGIGFMAYAVFELTFGADKLGRPASIQEIIEGFVTGLTLFLVFGLLKKICLKKTPTNQVTLRDDPHGQN